MKYLVTSIISFLLVIPCFSCTSVIISGKVTKDGRPVMMKHRDTDCLDNRIEWFDGEKYSFVALVNSDWKTAPTCKYGGEGEAWTGMNTVGFCIMNTATYDLNDDDVPDSEMDREGVMMFRALSLCETLSDFENLLDSLPRPLGVEANFGVIDAHGGAAYYEVNNTSWVKFDVNLDPDGYRVVTNFTQTGRPQDRKGVDRYDKARSILSSSAGPAVWNHSFLFNNISRSGSPILRTITSASIVFEGVAPGENPLHQVMWTTLGYPQTAAYVPVLAIGKEHIPFYLSGNSSHQNAIMCDNALKIKKDGKVPPADATEEWIDGAFSAAWALWVSGESDDRLFYRRYDRMCNKYFKVYKRYFAPYFKQ